MIRFLTIHIILFIYLLFRFVLPLKLSRPAKIGTFLLILLVSQHYLLRVLFRQMASPEAPRWLIMLEGWASTTLIVIFLLILVYDLYTLIRWLVNRRGSSLLPPVSFSPERRAVLFSLLAAGTAAYSLGKAVELPEIHSLEVVLPRLPKELDGLTLVQLTDIHVSPLFPEQWISGLADRVNSSRPDLILLTGDLVDGTPGLRANDIAPLAKMRSRYGIYGCVGNHEYYSGFRAWMPVFSSLGITMLHNSHALLNIEGQQLAIAGVTDRVARDFGLPLPSSAQALSILPENVPRIMLEHRPGAAAQNAASGVDLQLSGHTHGGHALGLNHLVGKFNEGFVYGKYTVDGMPLYVSSGAGLWNGFPVRLGVHSEIARIVLRAG